MKDKSGISLVSLILTITILAVIASIGIYTSVDTANTSEKVAFSMDLNQIEELVQEYYLNNNELPIDEEKTYDKATLVSLAEEASTILSEEITTNGDDTNKFYMIDLTKLNIEDTSRGTMADENEADIYVLASGSLNVYYVKGEKIANQYYFSLTEKLTGKKKVSNTHNEDTSSITIINSTAAIKLTKSTNEWTNDLKVMIETSLNSGESMQYYLAGQDVTSKVVNNTLNISNILSTDVALRNTFYSSDNNKIVTAQKTKNGEIIVQETVNVSNLDILVGNAISQSNITHTKYDETILAKISDYSDLGGSGFKEVRVLYATKTDSTAYYNNLPNTITKDYVYSAGVKNSSLVLKLPIDVKTYYIVLVDKAGNISESVLCDTSN